MASQGRLPGPPRAIRVQGARTHNLAEIDVELPRDALVVITGPSGSGKSSLAFDTIFAEGQRRYVESLSVGARQFLAQLPKPDVDLVEGLSPTVAIQQENRGRNPRSTVGTASEVYDFLRLVYARTGHVHSPTSGARLRRHSVEDMVEAILALPDGTRFSILAPVAVDAPGDQAELLDDLRRQGFVRVAIDDVVRDLGEPFDLDPQRRHTVEVYVDRLKLKDGVRGRVADSVETAVGLSGGALKILPLEGEPLEFSSRFRDEDGDLVFPEITPSLFSFNSPDGACPRCDGLGRRTIFDPARVVPNERLSLGEGAARPLARRGGSAKKQLKALAEHLGISLETPWDELPPEVQVAILEGTGSEPVPGLARKPTPYEGVLPGLRRRLREAEGGDDEGLDELAEYMRAVTCEVCKGARLRPEALAVRVGGRSLPELAVLPLEELLPLLEAVVAGKGEDPHDAEEREIAAAPLEQALGRLRSALELGLGYLTLDRTVTSLSGGEAQRLRLATQIGSALVGVTYVLDEPSVGLHARDSDRLVAMLHRLRDLGNTVLVVEHDDGTIRAADHVVEMGPGAGVHGGHVVAQGPLAEFLELPDSLTASYLSGRAVIPVPKKRRKGRRKLQVRGATGRNLQDVSVAFPVGSLTCVTGVSGSGKSSLVVETLLPEARRRISGANAYGLAHASIEGLEHFDRVIAVDQGPIGRSPRSNPATYTGIFTDLRNLYAGLPEARMRGYGASRFSFNVKGGRCESCKGEGVRRVEMHFLPDVYVTCQTCDGRRYNRETLAITYRGKNVAEVLELSVAEACDLLGNQPALRQKLEVLRDVGLGYLTLGQSALSLSGGEAQRIKLAKELGRRSTGNTLVVLDEPTTGLHVHDVRVLLDVFDRLVDEGNTMIVIEHDLDVVAHADHVIDMGPEGGTGGGEVVASGTPEQVSRKARGHTARYLKAKLAPAKLV